ncbi:MAG: hypothetical protein QM696_00330 [Steroidobacteraceae bacterium]
MSATIAKVGFWSGMAAALSAITYDIVQILQVTGALGFPLDEILIYGAALGIVVPFILEMLAFHHLTEPGKQFWTHGALFFTALYAVFVTANYVVQLATVIPAKLGGEIDAVRILDQTPHSLFWNFDATGYISMGFATLLAVPALGRTGIEGLARISFMANVLVTPLIGFVYFYPTYSPSLLFVGSPWAITAPLAMFMLALVLRRRSGAR